MAVGALGASAAPASAAAPTRAATRTYAPGPTRATMRSASSRMPVIVTEKAPNAHAATSLDESKDWCRCTVLQS